jgi:hypothetical protein
VTALPASHQRTRVTVTRRPNPRNVASLPVCSHHEKETSPEACEKEGRWHWNEKSAGHVQAGNLDKGANLATVRCPPIVRFLGGRYGRSQEKNPMVTRNSTTTKKSRPSCSVQPRRGLPAIAAPSMKNIYFKVSSELRYILWNRGDATNMDVDNRTDAMTGCCHG